jgi:hypothetical protein
MLAKPARIQFRPRPPAAVALVDRIPAVRAGGDAVAHRGAGVRRLTRRPVLACHWIAVAGGGLECIWGIESGDGASPEEPNSGGRGRRISSPRGAERSRCRLVVPAAGELET